MKLSCIVQLHSNEIEEIAEVEAGDVVAIFDVKCRSMDTLSENLAMGSVFVPNH